MSIQWIPWEAKVEKAHRHMTLCALAALAALAQGLMLMPQRVSVQRLHMKRSEAGHAWARCEMAKSVQNFLG